MPRIQSAKTIEKRQKAIKALDLRASGLPWKAVAEELGYSDESGARKAGLNLLEKVEFESVSSYRDLNLKRLEDLINSIWELAKKGDLYAIDRVRALVSDERELLGLDASKKLDLNATLSKRDIKDLSDDELLEIIQRGK
jgi:hypothetical protein